MTFWPRLGTLLRRSRQPHLTHPPTPSKKKRKATLEGTVTSLSTRKPIPGAVVSVGDGGRFRVSSTTDQSGHYVVAGVRPVKRTVELRAPSGTPFHRLVERREIEFSPGEFRTLDLEFEPRDYEDPPLQSVVGEFAGVFYLGFEQSEFVPKGGAVRWEDGTERCVRGAWVEFSDRDARDPFRGGMYRVRWRGKLTGPGSYGHCGRSDYSLEVTEVLGASEILPTSQEANREFWCFRYGNEA